MEELPRILLKLLGVAALVLLNGFFVAAEFALVKMRHTQLDLLIAKGHRRARIARMGSGCVQRDSRIHVPGRWSPEVTGKPSLPPVRTGSGTG